MNNPSIGNSPNLYYDQVVDPISRQNFKNLNDYFSAQNQLYGFNFFELSFSKAVANATYSHGLAVTPQDVLVSRITGAGSVTFNFGLMTTTLMNLTVTGACRIRFYIGTYWNYQSSATAAPADSQTFSAAPSTTTATVFPPGQISMFAGATAPSGWLFCQGQAVNRLTYASLFAAIGTTYGTGDGQFTFNLPNTNGVFVRGAGSQTISSIAYSGVLAAVQGDQVQGHVHTINSATNATAFGAGVVPQGNVGSNSTTQGVNVPTTDGTNGTPRVGAETRPANICFNYMIKT